MKQLLYILSVSLLAFSCEKVIDFPLDNAETQIIVEGKLYDEPQQSFVKLSKSADVYNDDGFEKISNATVTVTDDQNNTWNFIEDPLELGTYRDTSFLTQPHTTYNLNVINGTDTYTATSSTNSDVAFDTIFYQVAVGGFGQQEADTNFFTFFEFTDNAAETNFYRVIPYTNGEKSSTFYLADDGLFNGNNYQQPFFADQFESGDTLVAVLVSMDKPTYTFFYTLANNQDASPFSPTPGNPVTNIEGGAIGYFGAFMTGYEIVIYP